VAPSRSGQFGPLRVIANQDEVDPKGFCAKDNAAFGLRKGGWSSVLNPDVRLPDGPCAVLVGHLGRPSLSVITPAVPTSAGLVEENVRHLLAPHSLLAKLLDRGDCRYPDVVGDETFAADGVAGMFMPFRAEDCRTVGSFEPDLTCIRDCVHLDDQAAAHSLALEYLWGGGTSAAF
jgi:N-acetylglucosaminyl-diphospho-decaprenol L-rhamnosyltransferase